ncbi:hypothetical protein PILCRDRAFT_13876 [Piloderma croceum F 1598]|uniref:Protein kinase domain-containing protein n=1 Tax=Piloderma croceum (strain F 1598) TaxID=765440 RepID=A0A0C3F5A1_PILCF|nr:hypothetical protein PILCRDRAFT_13876 [Piloderma croceum F 1598]
MNTCKLPQELVDIIIRDFHDDPYSLHRCSLVCRSWLPTSHRHFFYRVVLSPPNHPYNRRPEAVPYSMRLYRVLLNSPHIANYIRELKVYEGERLKDQDWIETDQTLPLVLRKLTKLVKMEFRCLRWYPLSLDLRRSISSAFELPSLTTVEIDYGLFPNIDDFSNLLSRTKGLARLSLTDIRFHSTEPLAHEDREAVDEERSASCRQRHLTDLHLEIFYYSVFVDWLLEARSPLDVTHIHTLDIMKHYKPDTNAINRLLRAIGSSLKHLQLYMVSSRFQNTTLADISIEFNPHIEFLHIQHIQSIGLGTADAMRWLLTFLSTIGKSNHLKEINLEAEIPGYHTELVDWSAWGAVDSILAGAHFECLRKIDIANPPRLKTAPLPSNTKPSTGTPFYNKHFSTRLILREVKRLLSPVQDLANNVDAAVVAASETLPPRKGFITAEQRDIAMGNIDTIVTDEEAVSHFYNATTAKFCSPLASTLALHPKAPFSQWRSLVRWTQSGARSSYAITDGLLRFIGKSDNEKLEAEWVAIANTMESETRCIFEELREYLSPLGTWEMKSTCAGPLEVMVSKERKKVAHAVVGPDARDPPWKLKDDSSITSVDLADRDEAIALLPCSTLHSITSGSTSSMPPPPSKARNSVSGHVSPMKSKEKRKGRKRKRDEDGEAQDRHHLSAQNLLQQAWAQAVRVDGTIIILHSGNYELVCLRHRSSQTLYVSDIIEPPTCANPGYGKLHVGIYVAAIQDTIDRQKQLHAMARSKSPDDDDDSIGGSGSGCKGGRGHRGGSRGSNRVGDGRGLRKKSKFQGGVGRKDATVNESVAIEETMQVASNRDVVLIYLQYDVYDSPIPSSFLRSAPPIMTDPKLPTPPLSLRAIGTYAPEECLTIVLTSEIGRGTTGVVHRGTLKPETSGVSVPLDVVVKLAFDNEQRDALRSEYEVYRSLRSKGVLKGITTSLGFFDDSEGGPCALVMLYAGRALVAEPKCVFSVSDCKSSLSTLQSIHRAGILHGDIRQENILVSDFGVTIIDFGHSKQCDDQGAKDRECTRLRYILGMRK